MDAASREQMLEKIKNKVPVGKKQLVYKETRARSYEVYEIPVEYLIFNQYNGRIGTFVKQHEKLYGPINASTADGEDLIIDFLWKSKENRNKETLKDLEEKGQIEYGIVTRDGVIVDGNRRCMLLKKIAKKNHTSPTYFKAVILDETIESNPKEIRKLETTFQMGVDAKVDYNPIEKYLKSRELTNDGFSENEIAKMMGVKPPEVSKYLSILELMDQYLLSIDKDYDQMYRLLDKGEVEGPFHDLLGYLKAHGGQDGRSTQGRDWQPDPTDIEDLKLVYFYAVRAGFGAHDLRVLANPSKGQGLFNYGDLWKEHSGNYFSEMEKISQAEPKLDQLRQEHPEENPEKIIDGKELDYSHKAQPIVKKFKGIAEQSVRDQAERDKPSELIQRALRTLEQVDTSLDSFEGEDLRKTCHAIRKLAEQFIKELG